MVLYSCKHSSKVYNRYTNYVLHMQTAHGIALPRKRINDETIQDNNIQTIQGGGQKSSKKRRKVSDVAKQITIEDEEY